MLMTRPREGGEKLARSTRMNPASTTRSTWCARSASTSARSNAGARGVVAVVDDERRQPGQPRARERRAVGDVEADDGQARRAELAARALSMSACRLVPLPETRTPTFIA